MLLSFILPLTSITSATEVTQESSVNSSIEKESIGLPSCETQKLSAVRPPTGYPAESSTSTYKQIVGNMPQSSCDMITVSVPLLRTATLDCSFSGYVIGFDLDPSSIR